jgi:hypothetical protein
MYSTRPCACATRFRAPETEENITTPDKCLHVHDEAKLFAVKLKSLCPGHVFLTKFLTSNLMGARNRAELDFKDCD